MSLIRDGLAVIGIITVARWGYNAFRDHVQTPLEDYLTDVFDREYQKTKAEAEQKKNNGSQA